MFVPILLCTARTSNSSSNVANYVFERAKVFDQFDTDIVCVSDFHSESTIASWDKDEKKKGWQETMNISDGLIIVCPEYNHSYPGEFKIFIDSIIDEYKRKPLGVCTVSGGAMGGPRVATELNSLAIGLKMVPTPNPVFFTNVREEFDNSDIVTHDVYDNKMVRFFEDFTWYVESLKNGRNK
jgi:NAD(P)H-dependent FMN reductase